MPITLVNPDGLPEVDTHHQVAIASGSRTVFLAGQVAWGPDGRTVGVGDLAAQVEQCYLNVAAALAGIGGSFDDVAKLMIYVVDLTPDKLPLLAEGIARATETLSTAPSPPITALGVTALAAPDLLVEVDATAVLD